MCMKQLTLKGGYIATKINDIASHNIEISRGAGVIKSKKGKGSYSRKEKHKINFQCLFFLTNLVKNLKSPQCLDVKLGKRKMYLIIGK